jgi:hypothetical protein
LITEHSEFIGELSVFKDKGVPVYVGDLKSEHFGTFVQAARELDELPFFHIDASEKGYDLAELTLMGLKNLHNASDGFALRVYRRGSFKDFLEHTPLPIHSYPGKPAFLSVQAFKTFIIDS